METHTNSSEKSIIPALKWLGELAEFIEEPALENFGPIDLDQVAETDRPFAKRIIELASSDPDLLKRVVETRIKLGNEVKITNAEADEIINKLAAKYFAGDLDLSGYKFDTLEMARVIVTGNLDLSCAIVERDSNQRGMKVGLSSNQRGMKVGLSSAQSFMKVGEDSDQEGMEVGGNNWQYGMKVKGKWRKPDGTIVIHQ